VKFKEHVFQVLHGMEQLVLVLNLELVLLDIVKKEIHVLDLLLLCALHNLLGMEDTV
jgi:hypothetical protein